MFKTALVALKPSNTQQFVIDYAVDLAKRHVLELAVCTVVDLDRVAPAEAVPLGASAFKKQHDDQRIAATRLTAEQCVEACVTACSQQGVKCLPAVSEGDTPHVIVRRAHEFDLLIVGHTTRQEDGDMALLHEILKHSSRPAVVYPKKPVTGHSIVITYDASLQAARTLASFAYSGLAGAHPVHVVSIHTDPQMASAWCHQACRFLKSHGISATPHSEVLTGSLSDAVLNKTSQLSAGMLVMGAYGKNAVREFFFGSVTQSVLESITVPVFLNH